MREFRKCNFFENLSSSFRDISDFVFLPYMGVLHNRGEESHQSRTDTRSYGYLYYVKEAKLLEQRFLRYGGPTKCLEEKKRIITRKLSLPKGNLKDSPEEFFTMYW